MNLDSATLATIHFAFILYKVKTFKSITSVQGSDLSRRLWGSQTANYIASRQLGFYLEITWADPASKIYLE